ncbi:MAG TPA: hypothetical protein VHG35_04325 [Gemmatimonadales bacterium]|nr:hypothetical protein [Gemmatimonadales bacterium]
MRKLAFLPLAALALYAGCSDNPTELHDRGSPAAPDGPSFAKVTGAAFTTVDEVELGCLNGDGTINCNLYTGKEKVFLSGGPIAAAFGISGGAGRFMFAVLVPGFQNPGVEGDGQRGNLSDYVPSADQKNGLVPLNAGSGDTRSCRVFDIDTDGDIAYPSGGTDCTGYALHDVGTHAGDGKAILRLMPYDNTTNNGGVYILSVCRLNESGDPDDCKFDAFKVRTQVEDEDPTLSGGKYYDLNTNGEWDNDEPGITGWLVDLTSGGVAVAGLSPITTGAGGLFGPLTVAPGSYHLKERQPLGFTIGAGPATGYWQQTGNTVDQTVDLLNTSTLLGMEYDVVAVLNGSTDGLYFGNVCYVRPGGRTLGFWSNKNGLSRLTSGNFAALTAFNLRNANGTNRDFTASLASNKSAFNGWLLSANAMNMAYMLSAQMSATYLDVQHGFTDGGIAVDGALTVTQLITYANSLLANPIASGAFAGQNGAVTVGAGALRSEQERVKNIFDMINNNGSLGDFLQGYPNACPIDFAP